MRKLLPAFFIFFLLISCIRDRRCDCVVPYQIYYLKAQVIDTNDINCGGPVLSFAEDSIRISEITHKTAITFLTRGLPSSFNQLNKKLYVDVRVFVPAEDFPCPAYGISYDKLMIIDAKERQ